MIAWAGTTAISVSILIVLVLLLRRPIARTFGARAAYALWLAPALRAVMPSLPAEFARMPVSGPAGPINYWIVEATAPAATGPALSAVLGALWLGGAMVFLAVHWWRHQRFLGEVLAQGRRLDIPSVPYEVVASGFVDGPMATGLIHPLIIVPADFEQRFSADQQRFALWHEQLHHRRGDIWASAAALILTALLWFNPFAHLALGAFRRDMEAACDERLLAEAGPSAAPAYAETILRCAARPVPRSLCALTAIDELKGRLRMLKTNYGPARRLVGLFLAAGVSIAGLTLVVPAAADEPAKETRKFTKKIEIRHVDGEKDVPDGLRGDLDKLPNCPGEKYEVAVDGGTSDKKDAVKLVICTKAGESRAEAAKALERAAIEIVENGDMASGLKAELLAKLRAKIAELKSGA